MSTHISDILKRFDKVVVREVYLKNRTVFAIFSKFSVEMPPDCVEVYQKKIAFKGIPSALYAQIVKNEADIVAIINDNPHGFIVEALR